MHRRFEKITGVSNVDRRLEFVAGQDPDPHLGGEQLLDRVRNVVLELVLDRGSTDQFESDYRGCGRGCGVGVGVEKVG